MKDAVQKLIKGDVLDSKEALTGVATDASLFRVDPLLLVYPKDSRDIEAVVKWASHEKKRNPTLSLTARAAGTDMSGGPLNQSIILDTTRYMMHAPAIQGNRATVLPGTPYRDFEREVGAHGLMMPAYPASKNICAIGGMIGNNAGGELSLKYGKVADYVTELNVVFADGFEYVVKPLSRKELYERIAETTFEGQVYKHMFELVTKNEGLIKLAKPSVSKNSAGYALWDIWNGETFDLTKLFVGSQGTLGITTRATFRLVPIQKHTRLVVVFLKDIEHLAAIVTSILPHAPESFESYDDNTLKLAVKFFPDLARSWQGGNIFSFIRQFLPEIGMVLRGGMPKLVLLAEFAGESEEEVKKKAAAVESSLRSFNVGTHVTRSHAEAEKYWTIRRESFNLLRKHVSGLRTAPFIDDVIVEPKHLPSFLPELRTILDKAQLLYTIAGHAGNGNFHIIPLVDMKEKGMGDKLLSVMDEVHQLTVKYGGSFTAEHNDGIIRTPELHHMFHPDIIKLFAEVKRICDPQGIFNPGKKVGGDRAFVRAHMNCGESKEMPDHLAGPWC